MITQAQAVEAYKKYGSKRAASHALGIPRSTFRRALAKAEPVKIEDSTLKLRQQEKTINTLRAELKKAQDHQVDNASVKKYIMGIQDGGYKPLNWVLNKDVATRDDNIPVFLLSDLHWGEVIKPSQVFNLNEYNMTIASERIKRLTENAVWLLRKNLSPRNYPGFVLALNGDLVAGDIHEELSETNEDSMMPVVLEVYKHLITVIQTFADEFGKVFVPCCYGNHG